MEVLILIVAVFGGLILFSTIKILSEWERGVVLRLGRSVGVRGPGLILLIPFLERLYKVDLRLVTMEVAPQDIITQDNVSMRVGAVMNFRVVDPERVVTQISDFYFSTSQLAQTTLRSIMGQFPMDDILEHRDRINARLLEIIDRQTEPWGIKVSLVEVKNIDLPKEMQAAMARQAEAERERRAKVISAEGELQRAEKLSEASKKLAESPSALQLAYLQTLTEITSEGTHTIVVPLPLDLIKPFASALDRFEAKS